MQYDNCWNSRLHFTVCNIVDTVEVWLLVLIVQVLASAIQDFQWFYLGVMEA